MRKFFFLALAFFPLFACGIHERPVLAEEAPVYAGFLPLKDSPAFQQYLRRPKNDLSRLIYLLERFGQSDVEIIYEGFHLPAAKAAPIARWFLGRNYRHEPPSQWIYQWCNKTIPNGKLILVKFSDGTVRLGREVLFEELAALEKASPPV